MLYYPLTVTASVAFADLGERLWGEEEGVVHNPKTRPLDTRPRPNPGVFPDNRQEHSQRKISRGYHEFQRGISKIDKRQVLQQAIIEFGGKYSPMVPIGIWKIENLGQKIRNFHLWYYFKFLQNFREPSPGYVLVWTQTQLLPRHEPIRKPRYKDVARGERGKFTLWNFEKIKK